jgi:hypothetical protein
VFSFTQRPLPASWDLVIATMNYTHANLQVCVEQYILRLCCFVPTGCDDSLDIYVLSYCNFAVGDGVSTLLPRSAKVLLGRVMVATGLPAHHGAMEMHSLHLENLSTSHQEMELNFVECKGHNPWQRLKIRWGDVVVDWIQGAKFRELRTEEKGKSKCTQATLLHV